MTKIFSLVIRNRKGVSALEYGLMAALIAGALVTSVTNLSGDLQDLFTNIGGKIQQNTPN